MAVGIALAGAVSGNSTITNARKIKIYRTDENPFLCGIIVQE